MMTNHPCPVCYEPLYLILGPNNRRIPTCRHCDPNLKQISSNEDACLITSALVIAITFLLTYYFKS